MIILYALSASFDAAPPAPPPVYAMGVQCHPAHGFASYLRDQDYPAAAIRNREEGTVQFCVRIGPDGLVSDCTILSSSGFADLDAVTCEIARTRFRFVPAHDASGAPVADGAMARIRWVLPAAAKPTG